MGSFFCLRQYLSQLQLRIPVFVCAPGVRWHRPAARAAGAACGRHARRYSGGSVAADDPEPADVMGTGWFAADAANVKPGSTVVVVGDGAVGLLAVLSAKQMRAERIIAMS